MYGKNVLMLRPKDISTAGCFLDVLMQSRFAMSQVGAARLGSFVRHLLWRILPVMAATASLVVVVACGGEADKKVMEVVVAPERVECVGVAPMQCLVVDGEWFYDEIEGFEHEEGYEYRLKIEQYDAWPDREEPPQDAGRYGYRLIEILSKTRK